MRKEGKVTGEGAPPLQAMVIITPGARSAWLASGAACTSELEAHYHSKSFISKDDAEALLQENRANDQASVPSLAQRAAAEPDIASKAELEDVPMLDGNRIRILWPQTRPGQETRFRERLGTVRFRPQQERRRRDNVYAIEFDRRAKTAHKGLRIRKICWKRIRKRNYQVLSSACLQKPALTKWTDEEVEAVRQRLAANETLKSIGLGIGRTWGSVTLCLKRLDSAYAPREVDGMRRRSGVSLKLIERAMDTLPDNKGSSYRVCEAVMELAAKEGLPLDMGIQPGHKSLTRAEQSVIMYLSATRYTQFQKTGEKVVASREGARSAPVYIYLKPGLSTVREPQLLDGAPPFINRNLGGPKLSKRKQAEKLAGGDRRHGE
jgi:hypothetical protein